MRRLKAASKPGMRALLVFAIMFALIGSIDTGKSFASTGTVALQVGVNSYAGGKDVSHMVEQGENAGYYTSGQMPSYYIRDGGAGTTTNALIYFDLTGQIPAGATIDSATLSLYNTGNNAYIGGTVDLFRITDANNKGMWVEGNTSTAFDKTGAGWLRRAGTGDTVTTGWTNTSGSTIMDSVNGTASGNMTFATSAGWTSSTDIKSDIQAWANGSAVNQGWYMRVRSGTSINIQEVASNQYATAANRPKLTISYTTGTGSGPAGPTGYTFCAKENQTCSFTGSASVAYGANGAFNYLTLTGGTPCTNAVFGDPLVGTAKACYYQTTTTPPPLSSVYLSDIKFKSLLSSETAKMFYKKTTDSTYKEGQPFTKYDGNHMATSLFDLAANMTYDVKIQVTGSLGTTDDYETVKTKPAYALPTPIYDMQDDGIETDGIVVNARFFRNQIGRSKNAITIAPTYPGPVYIIRNATGGSLENNMKMNTGVAGIVRNVYIFNNTFVQKTSASGSYGVIYQGEPALTQDIVFKNNIFKALTRVVNGDMYANGYYHKRHSFDYDLGYSPLTSGTIYKWSTDTTDPLNNSAYTSLAAFRTATGQEAHGVWGDPLLNLSALAGYPSYASLYNMHLNSASSPAIDAGAVIPGITNSYNGSAPDIGAYEH